MYVSMQHCIASGYQDKLHQYISLYLKIFHTFLFTWPWKFEKYRKKVDWTNNEWFIVRLFKEKCINYE